MHSLAPQKTVPIVLGAKGISMAYFSWEIFCDVIPCSVILFPNEIEETIFHQTSLCCEKKLLPLTA